MATTPTTAAAREGKSGEWMPVVGGREGGREVGWWWWVGLIHVLNAFLRCCPYCKGCDRFRSWRIEKHFPQPKMTLILLHTPSLILAQEWGAHDLWRLPEGRCYQSATVMDNRWGGEGRGGEEVRQ